MAEVVRSDRDSCTGCNRCVRNCPMEMANVTAQDAAGNIKVEIDHEKCIACGRCLIACKHGARSYVDDTARFFDDLSRGTPISLIVAPSIMSNVPEWRRLFTYLRRAGVNKIYDVSLGADICIWAHVRHLEKNDSAPLITQPCPTIVAYCERYRQDLLAHLSPVHSPMACTAIYVRKHEGLHDAIAALSPCIAKANEFEETGLTQYNVTLTKLLEHIKRLGAELPEEETGFDHGSSGLGSLFPMPGGLKENIEYFLGKNVSVDSAEGHWAFEKLAAYADTPGEMLPRVFDVLNCDEGCNIGTACPHDVNPFGVNRKMDGARKTATEGRDRAYYDGIHKRYDEALDLSDFLRGYSPHPVEMPQVSDADIEKALLLLGKDTFEKRNVNCGACGNDTCMGMARRVALGVNIPANCMVKSKEDARIEHEKKVAADDKLASLEKARDMDERARTLLNAIPLCIHFWDNTLKMIDCNKATIEFFKMHSIEELLAKHHLLNPEFQPNGEYSEEKHLHLVQKAFNEGYMRTEWTHRTLDGELIPAEVTLVRADYKGKPLMVGYTRDMREQKRMIDRINDTAAMLKAVVSNYPGSIWSINRDKIVTLFDGLRLRELGVTPDYLEGKSLDTARDRFGYIVENAYKTFDGEPHTWMGETGGKTYRARTVPIFGHDREVTGVMGSVDDITEVVSLRTELEAAHQTTTAMFDSNPHINLLFDSSFRLIDCNPTAIRFLGFETKEEMLAGFVPRLVASLPEFQPDGRPSVPLPQRLITAAEQGSEKFETEINLGGKVFNLNVEFKKIPYGNTYAIVGHVFDMTELHNREMALNRARELNDLQLAKLSLAVQAAKIGLWEWKVEKDCVLNEDSPFMWSDELRFMLGILDRDDFPDNLGALMAIMHPNDVDKVHLALVAHLYDRTEQTPFDTECRLTKKDGDVAYFRATATTVRDSDGNPLHIVGTMMDITESKHVLLDTERHRIEAEAANKAKSAFLSSMSHEIRTPMNAILGITEIQLQNRAISANTKEAFEKIYSSGEMLLNIINDILDLSKIEAGKLDVICANYEIASTISDTVQLNIMRINSKPITFELNVDERIPVTLYGDELRIKQVLNNILSNAFKYTAAGTVKLSVRLEPGSDADTEVWLVFEVSDTGQGMTRDQVSKLFDQYTRFNLEANRMTEGTGLGMSIAHNLLRLMGGTISVESELGRGSTFTVRMPQTKVGTNVLGKEMAENLQRFRVKAWKQGRRVEINYEPMPYGHVLVVDDVEANIYVASGLMAPYGLKIDSASSGAATIDKVKQGMKYDIIFMDHMMPEMDGVEATKILRDMGYDLPIVALTANAVTGQANAFLENGFNDFISKPINLMVLNAVLNKLIRDKQPPEVIAAARRQAEEKKAQAPPLAEAPQDLMPAVSPQFAEIFVRDASKSLAALEAITAKATYSEADIHNYTIFVHGMKSALANIGNGDLSDVALRLEQLGREGKTTLIAVETPPFLRALRIFVDDLASKAKTEEDRAQVGDDVNLREKLLEIIAACKDYDENTADGILTGLSRNSWPPDAKALLDGIAECLLHSDFDDIVQSIEKFLGTAPAGAGTVS